MTVIAPNRSGSSSPTQQLATQRSRKQRLVWACLVVLLAAYLSRTFLRNRDWATEETLFTSAAKVPFLSTVYMPH